MKFESLQNFRDVALAKLDIFSVRFACRRLDILILDVTNFSRETRYSE